MYFFKMNWKDIFGSIIKLYKINDGYCDRICNTPECDFDGGDCKERNLLNETFPDSSWTYDAGIALKKCSPGCAPNWMADRFCDNACNNPECAFVWLKKFSKKS